MIKMYKGGDLLFLAACDIGGVKPTQRQYNKFTKQNRGAAYAQRQQAREKLNGVTRQG